MSEGSGSLTGCNQGVAWNCAHLKDQLGVESTSKLTHLVGRTQFLAGFEIEGLSSLLAVGHMPPSLPCPVGLSTRQFTTWQVASIRASK